MEAVARLSNVEFAYPVGDFRLGVREFCLEPGEEVALAGPSGCGKTTLLHLLAGILVPVTGRVEVDGEDLAKLPVEDRQDFRALRMGLVFQEFELLEYLDVLDNVLLPYRVSPALELDSDARDRAADLLVGLGLGDKLRRAPRRLSQGERQRTAVCRALVTRPAILLGDEPTGNLDPENRDLVIEALSRYSDETGAPVLVVTHDHELLPRFDRVVDIREVDILGGEV